MGEIVPYDHNEQAKYNVHLSSLKERFLLFAASTQELEKSPLDYDIMRLLGTGAFAIVFQVRDKDTLQIYAMKAMEKHGIVEKNAIKHVFAEKKIMQSIKFPFLMSSVCTCKDNVYVYIIMPFLAGGELYEYIKKVGVLEESLAQFYAAQVVLAIEFLHYCNIIHRDIKPENIFIDSTGYVKIGDFGFAKILKKTRTWTICGTPTYLAPEIIQSKGYSYSVDWWALGVLIFEMNAGFPPFNHSDPIKLYERILSGQFKAPSDMSPNAKHLVKQLLVIDPMKRYGSLKSGVYDIKSHKWFSGLSWDLLFRQKLKPPYVPPQTSALAEGVGYEHVSDTSLKTSPTCYYESEFLNF